MKKELIENIESLPALPKSVQKLENFRRQENQSIDELIKIIEIDPIIIANILKVVNSALFGFRSNIETISRAINLLGINFTISIALGSIVQSAIKTNLSAYNVSCDDFIYTAILSNKILNTWLSSIDFDLKEELLIPCFLQEIGKFVISDCIEKENKIEEFQKDLTLANISFMEEKYTGYSCPRITANIFKHWGLSPNLIFSIAFVGNLENCPKEYLKKAQILEIIKTITNIQNPLTDDMIHTAIQKVSDYGFSVEHFINSIDAIKAEMNKNS